MESFTLLYQRRNKVGNAKSNRFYCPSDTLPLVSSGSNTSVMLTSPLSENSDFSASTMSD